MRVSEHFQLGRSQPTLDFVDVDTTNDLKVFIDPRALRLLPSSWGSECTSLIQDFFGHILALIAADRDGEARELLSRLREPNETHLGLSRQQARGRGLGTQSARDVWEALSQSEAARSGLLEDLEDMILMVDGVGPDIVSDITTNLIREPLIRYTQDVCTAYGIPTGESDSGPLWDPSTKNWYSELVQLPSADQHKLLLVPKIIVRRHMDYDTDEYYRHYILEFLRAEELDAGSGLVELLKNGKRRVTNKALEEKYGRGKETIVRETRRSPEILEQYRSDKRERVQPPLDHFGISANTNTTPPDWDSLLNTVLSIPAGTDGATAFHHAVQSLLGALFYPALCNPVREQEIHEGRKRIDITFTNVATSGFFFWLKEHYPAPHVFVECKNYSRDLANPELDQIAGRFSPSRGRAGLVICRSFEDKELFLRRCRDTANDDRGFILLLDDSDLTELVVEARRIGQATDFGLLKRRFDGLIL